MKYFLLKEIVNYLKENAQIIKSIRRIDNNLIITEFNNKNILYFDISKGNATIFKHKSKPYRFCKAFFTTIIVRNILL